MSTRQRVIDEGVGPWTLTPDGSCLLRQGAAPSGHWPRQSGSWSREDRIPVEPAKRHRVTIVGESVARGFLLDPVVTLAGLCGEAFGRAGHAEEIEVVDFAVNGLAPDGALRLCRAAVELGSTVIVLYVGNNFLRSTPWLEPDTRTSMAETFLTGGYPNYHAARREAVSQLARRFRREMEELCADAGVQVVVVVPAVNLLDWSAPWIAPTWLPEDRLADWTATRQRLDSPAGREPSEEFRLASRLVELDGAGTPRPMELVGKGLVRRGRVDEGLAMLEESLSVGADPANYDRRCPPEVAAELRRLGEAPGFRLVDVPALSRKRFGERAFGRDTFLDYCHHTPDSLRLVADDIAGEVLATVGRQGPSGWTRRPWGSVPSRELAEGYLLTALHNQHWGQPAENVEHWTAEALRTDPASVKSLAGYFAMSTPDAHFWLTDGLLGGGSRRMHWFLKNFSHLAVLDAEFAERALRVLDENGAAVLRAGLDAVRQNLAVEETDGLNLLEPFWRERDGAHHPAAIFAGERRMVSRYGFVTAAAGPLDLEIVLTTGPGMPPGRFTVELNGRACHEAPVTAEWLTHRLVLPADLLSPGTNELAFRWPVASRDPRTMSSAITALGTGPESLHLVRITRMRLTAR